MTAGNLCVVGDTPVCVADGRGPVPFRALADAGVDAAVWCLDGDDRPVVRRMRRPRRTATNARVVRVHCDDGSTIRTTPGHRFRLRGGGYRRADELGPGDSLAVLTWRPPHPDAPDGTGLESERDATAEHGAVVISEPAAVAEWVAGRPLAEDEAARQVNGDRRDNRPENLAVVSRPLTTKAKVIYAGGVRLCRRLGRRFREDEWRTFARANGLPAFVRAYDVGRPGKFARDCAVMTGVVCHAGLDDKCLAKAAEGRPYRVRQHRRETTRRREAVEDFVEFRRLLGRQPRPDEWPGKCEFAGLDFAEVADLAAGYNHVVILVEDGGTADVYNAAVDEWGNYCVGGWCVGPGRDGRDRFQFLITASLGDDDAATGADHP